MSAYDTCTASPPFLKEGQGWFVLFIKLTLFTYFTIKGVPRLYTALPWEIFTRFHPPCIDLFPYIKLTLACIKHLLNSH